MTVHSRVNLNSDHRRHDRLLVTRFAAGDSYASEAAEAEALVSGCSDCAQLAADIRLLSQRTTDLTAPRRPRDFRISAEQADRLRGSWFEHVMRGLAAPGWASALRPVAGAAFALGMMLVVIGALPLGAAAPAAAPAGGGNVAIEMSASQAPEEEPLASQQEAPAMPGDPVAPTNREIGADAGKAGADPDALNGVYLASPEAAYDNGGDQSNGAAAAGSTTQSNIPLVYLGAVVALLGGALLVIVLFARRRYGDALIR